MDGNTKKSTYDAITEIWKLNKAYLEKLETLPGNKEALDLFYDELVADCEKLVERHKNKKDDLDIFVKRMAIETMEHFNRMDGGCQNEK